MINAKDIKPPQLPREIAICPELGGEVVIRGITLSQRLDLFEKLQKASQYRIIPELLSMSVLDISDRQVYTADQWDVFGSAQPDAAMKLYTVAKRLAGMEDAAQKK